jgi:hypothetical protein
LLLSLCSAPSSLRAEDTRSVLLARTTAGLDFDDANAGLLLRDSLTTLRLAQREERRREGFWLLGWGVTNAAAGAVVAGLGRDSPPLLAASLTSAAFGVINAALSFGLLDLGETRKRAIRKDAQEREPDAVAGQRERALIAQLKSGQGYALNAGLDVFYIASGMLLFGLGQAYGKRWGAAEGAGIAMAGQGAFLLGFDAFSWFHVNRRAEALRTLR